MVVSAAASATQAVSIRTSNECASTQGGGTKRWAEPTSVRAWFEPQSCSSLLSSALGDGKLWVPTGGLGCWLHPHSFYNSTVFVIVHLPI